ncbi:Monoamine regulon transcriptional regulator [Klebsiella pneumoniae]|uniref:Monoamine regulon transcriptional regulator n=1 Tax=Klebsiella pneumoniae TaxID=573 RepID=A0A377UYS7_KLEPN|nr:Monoamine regulon transcriptional regulator [Klebsiella pneumoniae]
MVREGASNKLIARQLDISLSTVKTHLRNIFAKTEVVNRTELVPEPGCRPLSVRCICNLTFASRARRGSTAFS